MTASNTAGDQRLEVGNKIVAIRPTKNETFIQTDEAAYVMTFTGLPFTFSFRLLGVNCGAVINETRSVLMALFIGLVKVISFVYNGNIQELPCSVQHFVFDRMQLRYQDKIHVGQVQKI